MANQPELDLQPAARSTTSRPAPRRRRGFGGFSRAQIFVGALLLAAAVWGMWVTRSLTAAKQDHIVSARLSALVGDYVEAQRYSGSPPERVRSEMQAFMASLDKELQRRSAEGQVVLVGEAVLTKNVPDITDSLKAAVFASGVPTPKRASAEEIQRMQQLAAAQAALAASQQAPLTVPSPMDSMTGGSAAASQVGSPTAPPSAASPQAMPGASVSTFGGPDGNGGQ